MIERAFLNCLSKTAVGLIIISFFGLFINPVYADNVRASSNTPSSTYSENTNDSNGILRSSFINEFSLKSAFAKSEQVDAENYEIDSDNIYIAASNGRLFRHKGKCQ